MLANLVWWPGGLDLGGRLSRLGVGSSREWVDRQIGRGESRGLINRRRRFFKTYMILIRDQQFVTRIKRTERTFIN